MDRAVSSAWPALPCYRRRRLDDECPRVCWAQSHGTVVAVGMEGTGSYGAGLLRFLTEYGLPVVEVDRPDRSTRRRIGSTDTIDAAFARLCGVAPIPASSGRTDSHRLHRGGDRDANSALWRIPLVRMRCHQPTKDYVTRRFRGGKTRPRSSGIRRRRFMDVHGRSHRSSLS